MFEKGDYIVYGSSGVCEVKDVGPMEMTGVKEGKLYYTLKQRYSEGGTIFTPVDNCKIVMRGVYSKGEAGELIETIPFIEELKIQDERKREEFYKDSLRTCDFTEFIRLIKLIYHRKKRRLEAGKKMASLDERYLKMAEDGLYGELEVSLEMSRDDVEKLVSERLDVD
ncbi:MAG: CarD family transcriptional regulator [Lachnospiraceae bacterium]|nr:CarD family transcriptional regulator [Lachnospiraceae bacterium]